MKNLLSTLTLIVVGATAFGATQTLDQRFPVRGLAIAAPSPAEVDRFVRFIGQELAPRQVNTLILRMDFGYQYRSRPELADPAGLSAEDARKLAAACRQHGVRLIPQINLLGHQSWSTQVGKLLQAHPEFDETPWVQMPEKYAWPNKDRLYCKSYCPLHPGVHEVVFAVVDEVCEVLGADAFHAGMDEVFYLGEDKCARCGGKDKAELFAGEVRAIRDHLAAKGRTLWIWGDRLLDGAATGIGEWEASLNGTHRALELVPRDIVICDWHYERADPTAALFALKGLNVVTCPWKNAEVAARQVEAMLRLRQQSSKAVADRAQGIVQTVWSGNGSFLRELESLRSGGGKPASNSEAQCFVRTFEEILKLGAAP